MSGNIEFEELECKCFEPPISSDNFEISDLGMDKHYGEAIIETCKRCGQNWLRYFYENEAFTKSGRWYRGVISKEEMVRISADKALEYLENLKWYIYGGSYFETLGDYGSGKIKIG